MATDGEIIQGVPMWCMIYGRRMEARVSDPGSIRDGERIGVSGLADRERGIVMCNFRGYAIAESLAGNGEFGIDISSGFDGTMGPLECSPGTAELLHANYMPHYRHGTMFASRSNSGGFTIGNPSEMVRLAASANPGSDSLSGRCGGTLVTVRDYLSELDSLHVSLISDVPLDESLSILVPDGVGTCMAPAVSTFLGDASSALSSACFDAGREFKESVRRAITEDTLQGWLDARGVRIIAKGTKFGFDALGTGADRWWNETGD